MNYRIIFAISLTALAPIAFGEALPIPAATAGQDFRLVAPMVVSESAECEDHVWAGEIEKLRQDAAFAVVGIRADKYYMHVAGLQYGAVRVATAEDADAFRLGAWAKLAANDFTRRDLIFSASAGKTCETEDDVGCPTRWEIFLDSVVGPMQVVFRGQKANSRCWATIRFSVAPVGVVNLEALRATHPRIRIRSSANAEDGRMPRTGSLGGSSVQDCMACHNGALRAPLFDTDWIRR